MSIYDRLKLLCKVKKVSIAKMERDIGVTKGAANKWAKVNPNSATLMKLAEYFNVDPLYITEGIESNQNVDILTDLTKMIMTLKNDNVNLLYGDKQIDDKTRQLMILRFENILDVLDISLRE